MLKITVKEKKEKNGDVGAAAINLFTTVTNTAVKVSHFQPTLTF
jgi:hypothetical protein